MGALLSSFSEEGIDEYMCSPDESWPMVELDDSNVPKTFRIKDVSPMLDSEGSTSGRVAKELIRHACESRGIEADITVPSSTCVNLALNEILESFHDDSMHCLRVPKDVKKIMQCISSGYPVSAVIPVTDEILEKTVTPPAQDSDTFAMLPVILWGYSSVSKKFAGIVPLSVYDEPVAISFSQVLSDDSCDFYVVNVHEYDDEHKEDSAEDVALFCD